MRYSYVLLFLFLLLQNTLTLCVATANDVVSKKGPNILFAFADDQSWLHTSFNGDSNVNAPMPGQIKVVNKSAGDSVEAGEALVVLEAMKMEHTLTSPRDGIIAEVMATVGEQVEDGAILLALVEKSD